MEVPAAQHAALHQVERRSARDSEQDTTASSRAAVRTSNDRLGVLEQALGSLSDLGEPRRPQEHCDPFELPPRAFPFFAEVVGDLFGDLLGVGRLHRGPCMCVPDLLAALSAFVLYAGSGPQGNRNRVRLMHGGGQPKGPWWNDWS